MSGTLAKRNCSVAWVTARRRPSSRSERKSGWPSQRCGASPSGTKKNSSAPYSVGAERIRNDDDGLRKRRRTCRRAPARPGWYIAPEAQICA